MLPPLPNFAYWVDIGPLARAGCAWQRLRATEDPQPGSGLQTVGTQTCLLPGGRPRGLQASESFDTNDLKALVSVQPPPLPCRAQGARDPITGPAPSPGLWLRWVAEGLERPASPRFPRCCGAGWLLVPGCQGCRTEGSSLGLTKSYETLGGRRAAAVFSTTKP